MDEKPKLILPFPEIGDPARSSGWVIKSGLGSLQNTQEEKLIAVPLGASDRARSIRFHELLHKTWSPANDSPEVKAANVSAGLLKACEDLRLARKAVLAGLGDELPSLSDHVTALDYTLSHLRGEGQNVARVTRALMMLVSVGLSPGHREFITALIEQKLSEDYEDYGDAADTPLPQIQDLFDRSCDFMGSFSQETLDWEKTVRLARYLEQQINQMASPTPGNTAKTSGGNACAASGLRWAPMKIVTPALPRRRPLRSSVGLRAFPRQTGDIFRNPYRILSDQAVFRGRIVKRGGTTLVDISLSMSFDVADLDEILSTIPGAMIATYCADMSGEVNPQSATAPWGELTIIGRDNKRVHVIPRMGTHNLIDGPALRWLSQQTKPRVWYSDGKVTALNSEGDRSTDAALLSECLAFCKQHQIKWARDLDEVEYHMRRRA